MGQDEMIDNKHQKGLEPKNTCEREQGSRKPWKLLVLAICAVMVAALGIIVHGGQGLLRGSPMGETNQLAEQYPCPTGIRGWKYIHHTELKLSVRHISPAVFTHSVYNPRGFHANGRILAGVVPHHDVAATLISGFFYEASRFDYDLVIILAPNHEADLADVVLSYRNWNFGTGVITHGGFVDSLHGAEGINTAISHGHMENDHAASIFIPYIYHFLPNTKVAPMLINRSLSFTGTIVLYRWLLDFIRSSELDVLVVASIDFSHFLFHQEAMGRDAYTKEAIRQRNFLRIHSLNYHYLDSAASLIMFLMYVDELGLCMEIKHHTSAAEFLGPNIPEVTSYMVIVGSMACEKIDTAQAPVRLSFVGDIMFHEAQFLHGSFDRVFYKIIPKLRDADLLIGNLETVFGGVDVGRGGFMDFPRFSAPDEFGIALKSAGFHILTTANNHSLDQGTDGLLRTVCFLESLGITAVGTNRNQEERERLVLKEVGGIRFAFLAYTLSLNGNTVPTDRAYLVNILSETRIRGDIYRARQYADFVIVLPHMGYEYELTVRQSVKNLAAMMFDAGADVVIANHPHVVQPMGFVYAKSREEVTGYEPESDSFGKRVGFVAYSLGNFISSQRIPPTDAGVILNLYFDFCESGKPVMAGYSTIPTWVKFINASGQKDIRILPVHETLARIEAGENVNLRPQDVLRLNDIMVGTSFHDSR